MRVKRPKGRTQVAQVIDSLREKPTAPVTSFCR
jgi:hypothetical protein